MDKHIIKNIDGDRCILNINASVNPDTIKLHMTLILNSDEIDDDRSNLLIDYMSPYLQEYKSPQSFWWSRRYRDVTVKSGAHARHVINKATYKIDHAYHAAILNRKRRLAELEQV